jgi:2,4-dienoyl-CoA reductase-like NADH-dependent reductase (Old Yellow Enzyme family)
MSGVSRIPAGYVSLLRPQREFVEPRALETEEIATVVEQFRRGAENAQRAGFDGVTLHAANGYLIDQFLQDCTNHRTDQYGGSVKNRARFLLEVTDAVISVWGAGRIGVHLSPSGESHDISDSSPATTFVHVARELGRRKLAFLFVRERQTADNLGSMLKNIRGRLRCQ